MARIILAVLGYFTMQKVALAASALVAEAAGPGSAYAGDIVAVVGQLGAVGVLAWYCWFVTAKLLPEMQRRFEEYTRRSEERYIRIVEAVCEVVNHSKICSSGSQDKDDSSKTRE